MSMMGRGGGPFGRQMGPGGGKPTNAKGALRRLIGRLGNQKLILFGVFIATSLSVTFSVLGPRALGQATNLVFDGLISKQLPAGISKQELIEQLRASGRNQFADMLAAMNVVPGEGVDFDAVLRVVLLVIALYLASAFFAWVQGYVMSGIAQRAVAELRRDVQAKLSRVQLKYVDGQSRGDLLSRVTNDIDNIGKIGRAHV